MSKEYQSPYSGKMLTPEEVVFELALHILCRQYIIQNIFLEKRPRELTLCTNGVWFECGNVKTLMQFPPDLVDIFKDTLNKQLDYLRPIISFSFVPSAEEIGYMLNLFHGIREIIHFVQGGNYQWDKERLLLIHGSPSLDIYTPSGVIEELKNTGILYLQIFHDPSQDTRNSEKVRFQKFVATGALTSISKEDGYNIAVGVNEKDLSPFYEFFKTKENYEEDSWASNFTQWPQSLV